MNIPGQDSEWRKNAHSLPNAKALRLKAKALILADGKTNHLKRNIYFSGRYLHVFCKDVNQDADLV